MNEQMINAVTSGDWNEVMDTIEKYNITSFVSYYDMADDDTRYMLEQLEDSGYYQLCYS